MNNTRKWIIFSPTPSYHEIYDVDLTAQDQPIAGGVVVCGQFYSNRHEQQIKVHHSPGRANQSGKIFFYVDMWKLVRRQTLEQP